MPEDFYVHTSGRQRWPDPAGDWEMTDIWCRIKQQCPVAEYTNSEGYVVKFDGSGIVRALGTPDQGKDLGVWSAVEGGRSFNGKWANVNEIPKILKQVAPKLLDARVRMLDQIRKSLRLPRGWVE